MDGAQDAAFVLVINALLRLPLRADRASGPAVDSCVSLLRGLPRKSAASSPAPPFGRKRLYEAQTSSSIPCTQKCSLLVNRLNCRDRAMLQSDIPQMPRLEHSRGMARVVSGECAPPGALYDPS